MQYNNLDHLKANDHRKGKKENDQDPGKPSQKDGTATAPICFRLFTALQSYMKHKLKIRILKLIWFFSDLQSVRYGSHWSEDKQTSWVNNPTCIGRLRHWSLPHLSILFFSKACSQGRRKKVRAPVHGVGPYMPTKFNSFLSAVLGPQCIMYKCLLLFYI